MNTSDNKKWLFIIAVILAGIFTILLIDSTRKTPAEKMGESFSDIVDSAGDGAREFQADVIDEIDDNRRDRR